MSGSPRALITCRNLKRTYPLSIDGQDKLELSFPDIVIPAGRRIALLGVSGSGKSTFLNLIAGLDAPDPDPARPPSIVYQFNDCTTSDMADVHKPFPRDRLGFVFQEGHLITDASAGINAALPGLLNGIPARDVDLKDYMDALRLPAEAASREAWRLSGGQKQRVALLRALFHRPQVIFADEPTSSLDKRTAEAIMRLIVRYQEEELGRTLFWATHDLQLAAEFATDFVIVRKLEGAGVVLEGPLLNPGRKRFSEIESRVYEGATVALGARTSGRMEPVSSVGAEVGYTQAKLGGSLTFARRDSRQSLFEIGRIGQWMASIESRPPPLVKGFPDLLKLYRRFSDHAVAGGVMMSMLMLGFVFLGLTTMEFFRAQAMSEPTSCNVIASAPDAGTVDSVGTELTQSLLTIINNSAPWRSSPDRPAWQNLLLSWKAYFFSQSVNPCGEARDLVFGRSTTFLPLHIKREGLCVPISATPKALVANLAEPAILGARVKMSADELPQQLANLIPHGQREIDLSHRPALTGEELFVTEALREQLTLDPTITELPANLADLPLCMPGLESQSLRIGGVISGLPQPRGLPYLLLVGYGSPWLAQSESYEQAVFYTHPERAGRLAKYLVDQRFAFSRDEIERMVSASARFDAINQLIWLIGGIVVIATFLFLYTCIRAFLEKNARSNAVLRAYGLTKSGLIRQIYWRLGAASLYALGTLLLAGAVLGFTFYFVFSAIGLPLPSLVDILMICLAACTITAIGVFLVIRLAVSLWWSKHANIAQELN